MNRVLQLQPLTLYWNRLFRQIAHNKEYWQLTSEDFSDFFLQKYNDDSFKNEIMKVLFEKDPLAEAEKKGILNSMYLYM